MEIVAGQARSPQGWGTRLGTRLGTGALARLAQRPTVREAVEVIEPSAAAVLELRAGVSAGVVEPPGGWLHPEHGTPRGRGRRETLLGDVWAGPRTIERRLVDVVRPGVGRDPGLEAASTAQLVLSLRTVRVAVTPHAGGQQQATAGWTAEEVICSDLRLLSSNNQQHTEAK